MKQLYLIGTVHSDPKGPARLEKLLYTLKPSDIFHEGTLADGYNTISRRSPCSDFLRELRDKKPGVHYEKEMEKDPSNTLILTQLRASLKKEEWDDIASFINNNRFFETSVSCEYAQKEGANMWFLENAPFPGFPSLADYALTALRRYLSSKQIKDTWYDIVYKPRLFARIETMRRDRQMVKEFEDLAPEVKGNALFITGHGHFTRECYNLAQRLQKFNPEYVPLKDVDAWPEPK